MTRLRNAVIFGADNEVESRRMAEARNMQLSGAWRQRNETVGPSAYVTQVVKHLVQNAFAIDRRAQQALNIFHHEDGGHEPSQNTDIFLVKEMPVILPRFVTFRPLVPRTP